MLPTPRNALCYGTRRAVGLLLWKLACLPKDWTTIVLVFPQSVVNREWSCLKTVAVATVSVMAAALPAAVTVPKSQQWLQHYPSRKFAQQKRPARDKYWEAGRASPWQRQNYREKQRPPDGGLWRCLLATERANRVATDNSPCPASRVAV